jgi:hypothetical protein
MGIPYWVLDVATPSTYSGKSMQGHEKLKESRSPETIYNKASVGPYQVNRRVIDN